jgi:serine/threonine protein phosphatase 1
MAIAIGDVHGCLDALEVLVSRLPRDKELVFLGDYVDRGPDSAGVLRYVSELAGRRPCRLLMGNHEALMAAAIARDEDIELWLINGGAATLASYGEQAFDWSRRPAERRELPGFARFYAGLALYHEDDSAIFVHAGIDLAVGRMDAQQPEVLLWIRERFFRRAELWKGKPILFGHTPTHSMGLPMGTIFRSHQLYGIDTGCVYGGALTALDSETFERWQVPAQTTHYRRTRRF